MFQRGYGGLRWSENYEKHAQSTYLDEHLWCKQNPVQKIHLTAKIEANPSSIFESILEGGLPSILLQCRVLEHCDRHSKYSSSMIMKEEELYKNNEQIGGGKKDKKGKIKKI